MTRAGAATTIGGARTAAAEQVLPRATVDRLTVEAGPAGLVLGVDAARRPVRLRLVRPTPTRVTYVGGGWAARLLVFRLLALGARVAVWAADPRPWTALDATAVGTGTRIFAVSPAQPVDLPADDAHPVVHLHDPGPGGVPGRLRLGPWQTQLTVLGQVTSTVTAALAGSDLLLLQRISETEAVLAAASLGLSAETTARLRAMPDDVVSVVNQRVDLPVWPTPTSIERHLFGPPAR